MSLGKKKSSKLKIKSHSLCSSDSPEEPTMRARPPAGAPLRRGPTRRSRSGLGGRGEAPYLGGEFFAPHKCLGSTAKLIYLFIFGKGRLLAEGLVAALGAKSLNV